MEQDQSSHNSLVPATTLLIVASYFIYMLLSFSFVRIEPHSWGIHQESFYLHKFLNAFNAVVHCIVVFYLVINAVRSIHQKNYQLAKKTMFVVLTILTTSAFVIISVTYIHIIGTEVTTGFQTDARQLILISIVMICILLLTGYLAFRYWKKAKCHDVRDHLSQRFKWLLALACVIFFILTFTKGVADAQFYYPTKPDSKQNITNLYKYSAIDFHSEDGTRLECVEVKAKGSAKATVLYFHGNGGYAELYFPYIAWLTEHGYNLAILEYRGYRFSDGTPSRRGLYLDSIAFLKWAKTRYKNQKLIVFGHSLGANIAINAIAESSKDIKNRISAIGLEGGFLSYRDTGTSCLPSNMPFRSVFAHWLVTERYSAAKNIEAINLPLIVMHNPNDNEVPFGQGRALFDAAKSCDHKVFVELEHDSTSQHIDAFTNPLYQDKYQKMLLKFFESSVK